MSTDLLGRAAPPSKAPVRGAEGHQAFSFGRKPIAEHNAEIAAHSAKLFPPDPGRVMVVFEWSASRECWLALSSDGAPAARPRFLNYDDKIEVVKGKVLKRRDMTRAELAALEVVS